MQFIRCQRCGDIAIAQRSNRKKYCSPRCASYTRVMKSRGKIVKDYHVEVCFPTDLQEYDLTP